MRAFCVLEEWLRSGSVQELTRHKHGDDPSVVERHIFDCAHSHQELPFEMRWVVAMRTYIDSMVALSPPQLMAERLVGGAVVAQQFVQEQEAIQQDALVPGEEYNYRTLPYYTYTDGTNKFLRFLDMRCDSVSSSGAVCRGLLAKFHGHDTSLYPTSSVLVCRKCHTGFCGHELVRSNLVVVGTRNLAALARHARRAAPHAATTRMMSSTLGGAL